MDIDPNSRFLLKSFRKYYKENAPIMPERFGRREFGFMFFDRTFVQRHVSFNKQTDLHRFLIGQVPSHCYYSTAYYQRPDAPTMEEKTWLGADLIFDLDADHLAGADKMSYSKMMEKIKSEMKKLVDDFLIDNLGYKESEIKIVFSGGRGYHAHIQKNDVIRLTSADRREIVDFITGSGLSVDKMFPPNPYIKEPKRFKNLVKPDLEMIYMIPPEGSDGWRGRIRNGLLDFVKVISENNNNKDVMKKYPELANVEAKKRNSLLNDLRENAERISKENKMYYIEEKNRELLLDVIKNVVSVKLSGEVDEPVTADIKRLIRLPNSVHGKSGLRVTPLSRNGLDGFDPLMDAVPKEYSDEAVKVTMRRDYEITIKGEHFSLKGETEVPEYAAVFLVGRKAADYGYLSERAAKSEL